MKKVKVRVPATTANLGPGFDIFGASLSMFNEVEVSLVKNSTGKFTIVGEGKTILPKNEKNILWKAMDSVFGLLDVRDKYKLSDFNIKLTNNIPLSSGLGSSSAARAGGIIVANEICGNKLSVREMVDLGIKLETHPDNIVPAFYGGICISVAGPDNEFIVEQLPVAKKMKIVVCTPGFELATERSRNILPAKYDVKDVVFNSARVALLTKAFCMNDFSNLAKAMQDKLHQPYRAKLIPVMEELIASALKAGAYGACLSGSGPSMVAFCSDSKAKEVLSVMAKIWKRETVPVKQFVLDFDSNGAKIIK